MADKPDDSDHIPEAPRGSLFLTAYLKYNQLWMSIARSKDLTEEDAEDIVHSVLEAILGGRKREFQSLEHARNYVAKSVVNRARETKIKGNRRVPWDDLSEERFSVTADEYSLDERGRRDALRRVLLRLPRRDFEIIKLRFYTGLTLAEVAKLMNIPISTISSREGVILERIRVALKKMGFSGMGDPF